MIYRITLDLAFNTDDHPFSIFNHAHALMDKAVIINPGHLNEERGYIQLARCYHDEQPTKPCEITARDETT